MTNQPNIVFLMPDQLRADFLGCYGARFVETPNIDRISLEGVRFARAIPPRRSACRRAHRS
ncbi:MAG: sulfatase-like hydrolase/transferase [Caldilineaceae bacterium]|nr:sulfatase-like hydrolase/transferase [Caldilineaceae bacterium]